ncbi:hypothetical protein OCAR_4960 [Afipia carboxidovorans OM5]|nr:hypothetical protein OCAR_4960 [Afipia carboxidovorans OM5]
MTRPNTRFLEAPHIFVQDEASIIDADFGFKFVCLADRILGILP